MHKMAAAARWLFLGTLVYAPWAYGCTRPWTISVLNVLLASVVALWLAGSLLERRLPQVPLLAVATSGSLLALGWLMALNAHYFYDPELLQFVPVSSPVASAPGATDGPAAREMMLRVTTLIGAFLFAIDLFQERIWRRRFAWTVVVTGASLIALGLMQRILGAPMIFWGPSRDTMHFFATYLYHGNAGAFINLVLPLMALWTLRSFREPGQHGARAVCVPALLITIAGAFVNVSKAAMSITFGLLVVIALLQLPRFWQLLAERNGARMLLGLVFVAGALTVLVFAGGWEVGWNRWANLPKILRDNPRDVAVAVAWKMSADAGWFGFGPGTFPAAFPHYTGEAGQRIGGVWRYLHQDYLQTVIEWGRLGAAAWGLLIFGGTGLALWHGTKKGAPLSEARPLYLAAALALAATALHALVDFPFQIASLQLYILSFAALGWSTWFRR